MAPPSAGETEARDRRSQPQLIGLINDMAVSRPQRDQLKRERKIFFVVNWLGSFVGNQYTPAALKTVDDFLKQNMPDPDLRLKILEVRDELDRTVRIRARWAN